jgi:hypothetical protein
MDINKIDAFERIVFDLFLPEDIEEIFIQMGSVQKMTWLTLYFANAFE